MQELADKYCVYRHEIDAPPYELSLTQHEALADPTLPRTKSVRCPKCNHNEAIYYKATIRGEDGLEDREHKILLYACRNCDHQEVADNNCVYRNEIHHAAGERTQVLQDVAADPTLPRTKSVRCANCNHGEAVFFQVSLFYMGQMQATSRGEEGMTLFFVCCNPSCGHRWRD
ncbi:hypothetical protein Cgig2_029183 [Carnegiea gigantea]|uniref:TFIIS-type domain-containing protein n=1 Tax=Carnegiea gigantea TaxID=171969 RepID=A0A9Q1QKE3_9CARY|nr:hypothetical protein Cgig2_029183 [Carnegiea gigantea]